MKISRPEIEQVHASMVDLLENANQQDALNRENIHGTNRVILVFTLIGAILTLSIFFMFVGLAKAINHSVDSMITMKSQVVELRNTMDSITDHVESMGRDVETLYDMNESAGEIALKTGIINTYIAKLNDQSSLLGSEVSYVRYHIGEMNQRFSRINQSMGGVAFSMHETALPIRQFIPLP